MSQMTIAQALTYKKRVASAILKTKNKITANNSVAVNIRRNADDEVVEKTVSRQGVDVAAELKKWSDLKDHMRDLKTKLWQASSPLRERILLLAELKDEAVFWENLSTTHGMAKVNEYSDYDREYDAVIQAPEAEQKLTETHNKIDEIQSEIDVFNHNNSIEIDKLV